VPLLVDYYSRDGSTLMMRLLASSPQVAVEPSYPYEHKYFAYLWRWSRLLTRPDWDMDQWAPRNLGSILQDEDFSLIGPPPWRRRDLMAGDPADPPISERAFDLVWGEFSRRATLATRVEHGQPDADVRYYAEKHLNSWALDRGQLPPLRIIALLRDPRDTYLSARAFAAATGANLGQREASNDDQYLRNFVSRQRERMRWIASLPPGGDIPVVRYGDLVTDLPGVARRLESLLEIRLDPESVARDRKMLWLHRTAENPEDSIGRWKSEMDDALVAAFDRELGPEMRALGFETRA
jgi:hypothetical protein